MLGQNIIEPGGYWTSSHGTMPWPGCGEIDIMEHWGVNQNYVQSAMHTPSSFGNTQNHSGIYLTDVTNDYHIYEMEWTPEEIRFSVDGFVHYVYHPAVQTPSTWPYTENQYILLNVAMAGSIDPAFSQSDMVLDYVRIYQASNPLPIELTHFEAVPSAGQVEVRWSTASEINNDIYQVERSKDAVLWENIGQVDGAGNSSQTIDCMHIDVRPLSGLSYYRLNQTDYDGTSETFEPVSVYFSSTENQTDWSFYPNPVKDFITLRHNLLSDRDIALYDMQGKNMSSKLGLSLSADGLSTLDLRGLAKGPYHLIVAGKSKLLMK